MPAAHLHCFFCFIFFCFLQMHPHWRDKKLRRYETKQTQNPLPFRFHYACYMAGFSLNNKTNIIIAMNFFFFAPHLLFLFANAFLQAS